MPQIGKGGKARLVTQDKFRSWKSVHGAERSGESSELIALRHANLAVNKGTEERIMEAYAEFRDFSSDSILCAFTCLAPLMWHVKMFSDTLSADLSADLSAHSLRLSVGHYLSRDQSSLDLGLFRMFQLRASADSATVTPTSEHALPLKRQHIRQRGAQYHWSAAAPFQKFSASPNSAASLHRTDFCGRGG